MSFKKLLKHATCLCFRRDDKGYQSVLHRVFTGIDPAVLHLKFGCQTQWYLGTSSTSRSTSVALVSFGLANDAERGADTRSILHLKTTPPLHSCSSIYNIIAVLGTPPTTLSTVEGISSPRDNMWLLENNGTIQIHSELHTVNLDCGLLSQAWYPSVNSSTSPPPPFYA